MDEVIEIPLVDEKTNFEFNKENVFETIEIPRSLIPHHSSKDKELYAIKIADNSAKDALLLPEDLVVLRKLRTQPQNGEFVVYQYDTQIKFGYFFKQKTGYIFRPIHPNFETINFSLTDKINIIGQVILVVRNIISDFPAIDEEVSIGFNSQFQVFHNNIKSTIRKKRRVKTFQTITFFLASTLIIWFFLNIFDFYWPSWTGFQQKTLWDWLELLIIPAVISFGIFLLNRGQQLNEQLKTEEVAREHALQQYLDKMTDILLDDSHKLSAKNPEQSYISRTRALTVLRGLDGERKGMVIRFLHEAALIQGNDDDVIIQLIASDLSYINLSGATLREINLNGTNLFYANMQNSDLSGSYLQKVFLYGANLAKANLTGANLSSANLENADLTDADLTKVNLTGAIVTIKQLKKAKSTDGIILSKGLSTNIDS